LMFVERSDRLRRVHRDLRRAKWSIDLVARHGVESAPRTSAPPSQLEKPAECEEDFSATAFAVVSKERERPELRVEDETDRTFVLVLGGSEIVVSPADSVGSYSKNSPSEQRRQLIDPTLIADGREKSMIASKFVAVERSESEGPAERELLRKARI